MRIEEIKKGVSEGKRNAAAFAYAMYCRRQNINDEKQLIDSLNVWNQKNTPPLPEKELINVVKSSLKYKLKEREYKTEKTDEQNVIRISSIFLNDVLYEQGYNHEKNEVFFL